MNHIQRSQLSILLVEDDRGDMDLVSNAFEEIDHLEFQIRQVDRLRKALDVLNEEKVDVVLLDLGLPDADGLETVARTYAAAPDVPIIVLTGLNDDITAMEAIKKGVQDYLVKGQMEGEALARSIYYSIERKQSEQALRQALNEKEILLKEIHHRVKNNLQIISSLLSLQTDYIADRKTLEVYKSSQSRINSMLSVHELLYHSNHPTKVDFKEYVKKLTLNLFRFFGANPETIKLRLNIDEVLLELDTAIPCGLVINEIVTNSLKHAFPKKQDGEIRIDFLANSDPNDGFTLTVADNGVGLPAEVAQEKSSGFGLQLIKTLITDELAGTIERENCIGTRYKLCFRENSGKAKKLEVR